jgi:peptidoglycan/LPS O-acetylase OafA/YrhL
VIRAVSFRASTSAPDRRFRRGSDRSHHRLDIEGLRGLAVLLVVFFHAELPGFDGGFVGVDVFFVISGFLITGLLLNELAATGRVSFATFYARRVRRLLPSAGLVIGVVVIASAFVLASLTARRAVDDGLLVSVFGANVRFAGQAADYFQAQRSPSPFLHFWSLSLEEQFYAVWPALLVLFAARPRFDRSRAVIALGAIFVVSLSASVWLTDHERSWAFFMLPARAWEFAVGGMLAAWGSKALGGAQAITWVGLVLIGASTVLFDGGSSFPGWIAVFPVIGAGIVIANGAPPGTSTGRLMGSGALPWLGRRSYVLYLWHWPMLVLIPIALGEALSLAGRLLVCAAAVVLADITHRLLERPVHTSGWMVVRPRRGLAVGVAIVAATVAVSMLTISALPSLTGTTTASASRRPQSVGDVQRALAEAISTRSIPANLVPPLTAVDQDVPRVFLEGCHADFDQVDPPPERCVYGDAGSDTGVVVMGDSHAAQWLPALETIAARNGFALIPMTKSSCPAAELSVLKFDGTPYPECDGFRERALDRIRALEPAVVIFSNSAAYNEASDRAVWRAAYERTVRAVSDVVGEVVILGETPRPEEDVPACLSSHPDDVRACVQQRGDAVNRRNITVERRAAQRANATFVETTDWACTARTCPAIVGRLLVWRDDNHLATGYVRWLTDVVADSVPLPGSDPERD